MQKLTNYDHFQCDFYNDAKRTDDHRYVCYQCGKKYTYRQTLLRHCRYECNQDPQFKCSYCPYKGRRREHLRTHILTCKKKYNYEIS